MLKITVGSQTFSAEFEDGAPHTVAAIRRLLPIRSTLVQARWSGEAGVISMKDYKFNLGDSEHESFENHTHFAIPGALLIYPGGFAEVEILLAYGAATFDEQMGHLAGNHFATISSDRKGLQELGHHLLWEGAQSIVIEEA
jgi:hypothetical protein